MGRLSPRSTTRERTADEVLIRHLYNEHGGALLAYAQKLTGDRHQAEDIVQETVIRAWRRPDALTNNKGSVRGWLITIVRNLVIDWSRAKAARPAEVAETVSSTPIQRDHADPVVDMIVVLGGLYQLSPEHRAVLEAIHIRGLSVEQAAAALGIPSGTVKSRCHHALRHLRDLITETPPAPGRPAEGMAG